VRLCGATMVSWVVFCVGMLLVSLPRLCLVGGFVTGTCSAKTWRLCLKAEETVYLSLRPDMRQSGELSMQARRDVVDRDVACETHFQVMVK